MENALGRNGQSPNSYWQGNGAQEPAVGWDLLLEKMKVQEPLQLRDAVEIREFQLGDELCCDSIPKLEMSSFRDEQNPNYFYLINRGRVRLLGWDGERGREVCAAVLEAGDAWGGDGVFVEEPLGYRVVAASSGSCSLIRISVLETLFAEAPALKVYLEAQAQRRQCQIFLKTLTEFHYLPSHQLGQILPYLEPHLIPSGAVIARSAPAKAGRFWLRRGIIHMDGNPPEATAPGTTWGGETPVPIDWKAQTELAVYHISAANWETLQGMLPAPVAPGVSATEGNGRAISPEARLNARVTRPDFKKLSLGGSTRAETAAPETDAEANHQSQASKVPFPKPTGRKLLDVLARYPFIQQQSSSDCGAACLCMIGQYWGKRYSINSVRELAGVGRSGASLKGLAKAAENLGFHARPVRASLSRIEEQENPWIAHWEGIHYVVVYRIAGKRVLIADPGIGKRWLSRAEFLDRWTGYALLVEPTTRLQDLKANRKTSLLTFLAVLWPYRYTGMQIVAASLLIQLFGVVTPMFTQIILDQVVVQGSLSLLNVFALGVFIFGVGGIIIGAIRQYLLDYFSNQVDLTLIAGFISHALQLPLKFFESRRVGDIITRVQENQKIQRFLIRQVVLAWLDFLMGFVYLALMLYYNWSLTLLVLAMIPPIAILTLVATPFLRKVSREVFNAAAEQNSSLVEMMTGVATVKAAAAERDLRWRWEDHLTTSLNARFRGQKLGNMLQVIGGLINSIGSTLLLWYGASLVIQGQLSIGQFVAFNMMIGRVMSPFLALVNLWDELQEVWISVERLNDVFATEPEEIPGQEMLVLSRLRGEVRFDNVTFRYGEDEERNTLQNISFAVAAGQTVAIVGRSGSGKTTLVKLLQGLYHTTSGRILIDGHDVGHISPHSLRSQLGVVPQECFLFSGTILENITLYDEEVSLEEAVEVAQLAEAHAFIQDLPLGYSTQVGERGASLSGGQRQRIAIARALLGEPRIVILDEATSSLDTESERRFQQNLARISRDRTTFIIAHRLSTVRNADAILVLDRGLLVEQGTHPQLMEQKGLYYHLAEQQLDL